MLPNSLVLGYFGLFAAPVYVSEASFVVDQSGARQAPSLSSILSQADYSLGGADLVKSYIRSPASIESLNSSLDLRKAYAAPRGDFAQRFGGLLHPVTTDIGLQRYMRGRISDTINQKSSVSTLKVAAYSPADARKIGKTVLSQSLEVINSLNKQRVDQVATVAHSNVEVVKAKLATLESEMLAARSKGAVFSPKADAQQVQDLIEAVQKEVLKKEAQLQYLQEKTPDSVQIPELQFQLNYMRKKIKNLNAELSGSGNSISSSDLKISSIKSAGQITEKLLLSAREAEQAARVNAAKSDYFIEVLSPPSLPDQPDYTGEVWIILGTLLASLLVWSFLR
ncbi:hypothetical protein [uncultured Thioclava sp.]|uniref:hypothetical protein n=1 Tax=uncultured Thioclava sp. TaxID=473858 RepID=UPI0025EF0F74|nr:hypothetical protein [uncultured Thioclava sp.]